MTERIFRIGQTVKVIAGPRTGEVTTVESALVPAPSSPRAIPGLHWTGGELVHLLGLVSRIDGQRGVAAPPDWLTPHDPGREPAEWTEELRRLCGVGTPAKERA